MIESKEDYYFYLEADKMALRISNSWTTFMLDDKLKYEKLLRKLEYFQNCKKRFFWRPYIYYLKFRCIKFGRKLGFIIPPNVFGPGLSIAHLGIIIVNGNSRVGENCRIHNCVHIGTQCHPVDEPDRCPKIGNNVFIGPGAVIVGDIIIADNIAIGANSYVNKSFLEPGITIAGAPAKKVSDKGSNQCYFKATEILREQKKRNP
jgi:serine O-acetyltransferase